MILHKCRNVDSDARNVDNFSVENCLRLSTQKKQVENITINVANFFIISLLFSSPAPATAVNLLLNQIRFFNFWRFLLGFLPLKGLDVAKIWTKKKG